MRLGELEELVRAGDRKWRECQEELWEVRREWGERGERVRVVEGELEGVLGVKRGLDVEVGEGRKERHAIGKTLEERDSEIHFLKTENYGFKGEISELDKINANLSNNNSRLCADNESLKKDCKEKTTQLADSTTETTRLASHLAESHSKQTRTQSELNQLLALTKDLENQKADLKASAETLTSDLHHSRDLLNERDRCINELKSWLEDLALKNSDFELDSDKLRERLSEAGWREGQQHAQLQQQLEENEREIKGLKEEVKLCNDDMLALRQGYMELETVLAAKNAEFEILESEFGDAKR